MTIFKHVMVPIKRPERELDAFDFIGIGHENGVPGHSWANVLNDQSQYYISFVYKKEDDE